VQVGEERRTQQRPDPLRADFALLEKEVAQPGQMRALHQGTEAFGAYRVLLMFNTRRPARDGQLASLFAPSGPMPLFSRFNDIKRQDSSAKAAIPASPSSHSARLMSRTPVKCWDDRIARRPSKPIWLLFFSSSRSSCGQPAWPARPLAPAGVRLFEPSSSDRRAGKARDRASAPIP